MKKKSNRLIVGIICAFVVLWGAVFTTDYIRCSALKEPIFVIATGNTADDGGSGTYQGLGYTVHIQKYMDVEYGVSISAIEMKVFGKVIVASIT